MSYTFIIPSFRFRRQNFARLLPISENQTCRSKQAYKQNWQTEAERQRYIGIYQNQTYPFHKSQAVQRHRSI